MKELTVKELTSRAGKARVAGMTFEQLSEQGKKMVDARVKKFGDGWKAHLEKKRKERAGK